MSFGLMMQGSVTGHLTAVSPVKRVEARVGRTEEQEQNRKRMNLISFSGFYFTLKGRAG